MRAAKFRFQLLFVVFFFFFFFGGGGVRLKPGLFGSWHSGFLLPN